MKFIKSKKIIFIVIGLLLAGLIFYQIGQKKKLSGFKIDLKKSQFFSVKTGDLQKNLIFSGEIDSQNFAVLRFQSGGQLSWLGVKEGDRVKKWQAIASLDKESLKKSLQKEMNDYLTSRWNFEDTQDEYKETKDRYLLTPEIQRILDRQQFTLDNSVLDYEISNLAVKYATLISPIEGIVTNIDYPSSGINILSTNFSITVIDPNSIYFKTEADEEDVTKIFVGQKAKIILDSYSDELFETEIIEISFVPTAGQSSTVYEVKFKFPALNDDLKYRIGMNGDAEIIFQELKSVLLAPVEAIYEDKEEKFVYLKKDKSLPEKRIVQTGLENDEYFEIIKGLQEGDIVLYNE